MIPLTVTEVTASLQRILVFFFPEPKEQMGYINAIHEAAADLCTPDVFDRACCVVAQKMTQGKKPVPADYIRAIQGIHDLSRKKGVDCEQCKGRRLIYSRVYAELYDKTVEALIPCPSCSKPTVENPIQVDHQKRASGDKD